jgi:hypothetical protein
MEKILKQGGTLSGRVCYPGIQGGFHARRTAMAYRDSHPDHHSSVSFQCRLTAMEIMEHTTTATQRELVIPKPEKVQRNR